jgi:chromosome transmission fidelity protein 4
MDSSLIKIMQITSKADRLEQALEAARLLTQIQSLDAAARLAAFFHQPGLQERVLLIKEARSGEDLVDKERRESKWSHLIDNRTLVDSNRAAQDYTMQAASRGPKASASSVFSRPVEAPIGKQSFGDSSALASHKTYKTTAEAAKEDSGHGSSEHDYEQNAMDEDEPLQYEEPMEETAPEPQPAPKAVSKNPFAKTSKPKAPPPVNSNPFAKKATGNVKEIKRSDSFFNRVEAKTQTKAPKDNSRQATLFGKPPPEKPAAPEGKRGRKRKSDAEAQPAEEEAAAKKSDGQRKLSFGTKPAAQDGEASATESGADVSAFEDSEAALTFSLDNA